MKKINKKQLYESIMKSVAKEVRKYLNENYDNLKTANTYLAVQELSAADNNKLLAYVAEEMRDNYTEADIQRTLDKMGRLRCSLEYANHALAEFLLDSVCEWLNDNGHQELCDLTFENVDLDKLFFALPVKQDETQNNESNSDDILKQYGLNTIFENLNESAISDKISALKDKVAAGLSKIQSKYGVKAANNFAKFVQMFKQHSKRALLAALMLVSMFAAPQKASAALSDEAGKIFIDNFIQLHDLTPTSPDKDARIDEAMDIIFDMVYDTDVHYYTGFGRSDNQSTAFRVAEQEALENYKKITGKTVTDPEFGHIVKTDHAFSTGGYNKTTVSVIAFLRVSE